MGRQPRTQKRAGRTARGLSPAGVARVRRRVRAVGEALPGKEVGRVGAARSVCTTRN